jgi:energy-coupling factor transporter transmembrane protein EcfT
LFFACIWSFPDDARELVLVASAVAAWLVASGIPRRFLVPMILYGLLIFGPFFLLIPWIDPGAAHGASDQDALTLSALRVPWRILVKGMGGMLIAAATVSSLTISELYESLARFPLPRIVTSILVQIVHQAGVLAHETSRISRAMAVRGGVSGWKNGLRMLASLPSVWLPRVFQRAERVAVAMELRDYGYVLPQFTTARLRVADVALIAATATILALVLVWRFTLPV